MAKKIILNEEAQNKLGELFDSMQENLDLMQQTLDIIKENLCPYEDVYEGLDPLDKQILRRNLES